MEKKEYIERETAIVSALNGTRGHGVTSITALNIVEELENVPAADVVEVVRCKDCQHWGGVTYGFVCRKFSGSETKICMGAEHYCSYGERKTDEK